MPAIRLILIAGMLATMKEVENFGLSFGVVHVTGDALDGPEEDVKLKVKVKKFGGGTKTYTRTVESDDIEKTLEKIGKKGTIIDVQVEPAE